MSIEKDIQISLDSCLPSWFAYSWLTSLATPAGLPPSAPQPQPINQGSRLIVKCWTPNRSQAREPQHPEISKNYWEHCCVPGLELIRFVAQPKSSYKFSWEAQLACLIMMSCSLKHKGQCWGYMIYQLAYRNGLKLIWVSNYSKATITSLIWNYKAQCLNLPPP